MIQFNHDHAKCRQTLISRAEQICAQRGSRFTEQRKQVLTSVAESHNAVGAYEIIERMAAAGARPAPITVYRALDFLLEHDLVHKIESRNAFVACNHSHAETSPALLICDQCGTVNEIVEPVSVKQLLKAASAQGFKPKKAMIEVSGTCGHCMVEC